MIYAFIGKTGAGKTTIAKKVSKLTGIPIIVTFTSRPKRVGEVNKVDYNFVTNQYFEAHKSKFIDLREYTVASGEKWLYGIKKSNILPFKDYLVVVDTEGYKNLSKYFKVMPIIIDATDIAIYQRLKKRGDDIKEVSRRLKDDEAKISNFMEEIKKDNKTVLVIDNTDFNTTYLSVSRIKNVIKYIKSVRNAKIITCIATAISIFAFIFAFVHK